MNSSPVKDRLRGVVDTGTQISYDNARKWKDKQYRIREAEERAPNNMFTITYQLTNDKLRILTKAK